MLIDENICFRSQYQQRPIKTEYEPYRYIAHNTMFGTVCDLKLSLCELTCRLKVETPIDHRPRFKRMYKDYEEFGKEWEKVE